MEERARTGRKTSDDALEWSLNATDVNVSNALQDIPPSITIVSLSHDTINDELYITRINGCNNNEKKNKMQHDGIVMVASSFAPPSTASFTSISHILSSFDGIIKESNDSTISSKSNEILTMTNKEKDDWWKVRNHLNHKMKNVLRSMEQGIFNTITKCALLGELIDTNNIIECIEQMCMTLLKSSSSSSKKIKDDDDAKKNLYIQLKCLLSGADTIQKNDLQRSLTHLLKHEKQNQNFHNLINEVIDQLYALHESIVMSTSTVTDTAENTQIELNEGRNSGKGVLLRHPVILLLDKHLSKYPWESMPLLRKHPISRMPSIYSIQRIYQKNRNKTSYAKCFDVGDNYTSFVINPSGDLSRTEKTFRDLFCFYAENGISWNGCFGSTGVISHLKYVQQLCESNMMIYCGHGSSENYFQNNIQRKVAECNGGDGNDGSLLMLMGCSSVKLKEEGKDAFDNCFDIFTS